MILLTVLSILFILAILLDADEPAKLMFLLIVLDIIYLLIINYGLFTAGVVLFIGIIILSLLA